MMNSTEVVGLAPFGVVRSSSGSIAEIDEQQIIDLVAQHRVLVLRGLDHPADDDMLAFGGRLGEILLWNFGAFNELRFDPAAANYLYTNREVPLHWDGAFIGRIPRYIFFYCAESAGTPGGETTFCDTTRVLAKLSGEERAVLSSSSATYRTDKIAHYGGEFTSPLVIDHPLTAEPTIRFAEPVDDLNPVAVELHGAAADQPGFIEQMQSRLFESDVLYEHRWQAGDIVLADNHALLHGRRAFGKADARHLRRLNIL